MTIVLIIQKDTLENDKVKSFLKIIDVAPEIFLSTLQESHCFICQLVAFTNNNSGLFDKLINIISPYKTNFGKDWYEFDHETLAKIISLFLDTDKTVIDFTSIKSIFGFNFQMFPVITKEIKISNIKEIPKEKEEILSLIDNLQESDVPKRKKESSSKKRTEK